MVDVRVRRWAGTVLLAAVVLTGSACGSSGSGAAPSTARGNGDANAGGPGDTMPGGVTTTAPAAGADGPACDLVTFAELDQIGLSGVARKAVTKPVAKGAYACQWTSDGPVVNLFTFAPGKAAQSFDDTREAWIEQQATITDVAGVGDRAFLAKRSSMPITHLVVLAGDAGFDIQSNASDDELQAIAKAAVPRLATLPTSSSTTTTAG